MFFFSLRRTFLAPAVRALGGITYQPSSCRRRCASGPCGCARWSWCADHAREGGDDLTAEVTCDLDVGLEVVAQGDGVGVGEVADAGARVDPGGSQRLLGAGTTHSEDVGESDLDALLAREVHTNKTCHVVRSFVSPEVWCSTGPGEFPKLSSGHRSPASGPGVTSWSA